VPDHLTDFFCADVRVNQRRRGIGKPSSRHQGAQRRLPPSGAGRTKGPGATAV
jgi:hypothetical protein